MSVAATIIEGIVEVPKGATSYCDFFKGDLFNRGSQVATIAFAVGAIAYLIFGSIQADPKVYGLCIVIALISLQNAWSLQRVIELGGYERQNARLERRVEALSEKVNEFAIEITRMHGEVTRFEVENARLEETRAELAADVGRFTTENSALHQTRNELTTEVDRLKSVQVALQGVVTSLSGSADATELYIKKEQELHARHQELLAREEALQKEEEELLKRLARDVGRLEDIVRSRNNVCIALIRRVIPLHIIANNLADRMSFIREKNPELVEEARLAIRARRLS